MDIISNMSALPLVMSCPFTLQKHGVVLISDFAGEMGRATVVSPKTIRSMGHPVSY